MTYRGNRPTFVSPFDALRTHALPPGTTWFERVVDGAPLEDATARIYKEFFDELQRTGHRPLRLWNFVPRINADAGADGHGDRERYKLFNRARYVAWSAFDPTLLSVCAGTAVGSHDEALRVFGIAVPEAPVHLENPRQIPFLSYSSLYGTPPCSRRASRIGHLTFIAGTASIVGEATVDGSTWEQLDVTLANLRLLASPSSTFSAVRVYVRSASETDGLRDAVCDALGTRDVVAMTTEICRVPLRLEIECVASAA